MPLEFSVAKDAHGQTVIRVTSKEPVRSTYLDFLIEANWPKGRMLREYTVLLDPPLYSPQTVVAASPRLPQAAAPVVAPVPFMRSASTGTASAQNPRVSSRVCR